MSGMYLNGGTKIYVRQTVEKKMDFYAVLLDVFQFSLNYSYALKSSPKVLQRA